MTTEITTKSHNAKQPAILRVSDGESLVRRVNDLFYVANTHVRKVSDVTYAI